MITNPAIRTELERLAAEHGGVLKPEVVIESARADDSPLHSHFEWDDSEAAARWRLHQARNLINVIVRYEGVGNGKRIPVKVFVSLTPDREEDGGGYRVSATVLSDAEMRRQLLLDARKEMAHFREKYAQLSELAKVFEAMDQVKIEEPELSATA